MFTQIEGADSPSFSARKTHAYEAGDRDLKLALALVSHDSDARTMTVAFDPPIEPGREITVALKAHRNPREDTYLYEVNAFPPGVGSQGQRIGLGRLQFYKPEAF